jgi:hypothetical protein
MTRHQFGEDLPGWYTRLTDAERAELPEPFTPAIPGANGPANGHGMYPPFAEAGRARCSVVPYLRPALDAVDTVVDGQLPAAAAGDPDAIAAVAAGIDRRGVLLGLTAEAPSGTARQAVNITAGAFAAPTDGQLARVRVWRIPRNADDPELGPCWSWRCSACGTQSNGCSHVVLHEPGTWRAAMCGGVHHVHTEHPRPLARLGDPEHTMLGGRRRCDWSPPHDAQLRLAALVLCGRTGYPRGPVAREIAREVLALAGRRTP